MMTLALWALVLTSPSQHVNRTAVAPAPAASVQPLSLEEARERVQTYLNSIDSPIPEASWVALGPNAAPALQAVIDNPQSFSIRRSRAISALALVSPKTAGPKVLALAKNAQEPYIVRAAAMRAAGRVLTPAQLQTHLQPLLQKDPNVQVRASAGSVLSQHAGACDSVRAQVAREKSEDHGFFHEALERCNAP